MRVGSWPKSRLVSRAGNLRAIGLECEIRTDAALIEETFTTIAVYAGWEAVLDDAGDSRLERASQRTSSAELRAARSTSRRSAGGR